MGNKDYIDTVVLTEESQTVAAGAKRPIGGKNNIPVVNDLRLTRVGGVQVTELAIDESQEGGVDPYNSTGKHCVLKRVRE